MRRALPGAHHHHRSFRGFRSRPEFSAKRGDDSPIMRDTKTSSVAGSPLAIPVGHGVARRDFLNQISVGALGIAGLGSVAVTYQYYSPNVLFEPSTTFSA